MYKYEHLHDCGDATSEYRLVGKFPVAFREFFKWVLESEDSFRVEFAATNRCYGGWLGNRIEVCKPRGETLWHWSLQKPDGWFDEVADKKITQCRASGGWGQMTYFCTFEE